MKNEFMVSPILPEHGPILYRVFRIQQDGMGSPFRHQQYIPVTVVS